MENRGIIVSMKIAQEQGLIPSGDVYNLFHGFLGQVFNLLYLSDVYNLPFPPDSYFLNIIQISDEEKIQKDIKRDAIYNAVCRGFTSLCYISIPENSAEVIRNPDKIIPFENTTDLKIKAQKFIKNVIREKDRAKMEKFFDFSTLSKRMKNRSVLSIDCKDVNENRQIHTLLPVKRDENGVLTEVLAGIQVIDKDNNIIITEGGNL